jgi:hypothetical protein
LAEFAVRELTDLDGAYFATGALPPKARSATDAIMGKIVVFAIPVLLHCLMICQSKPALH